MNAQALMKDLRILKQEELTLVNLASKIGDQLNRLKVEELALQNMVRLQNEELERKSRGSQRSINKSLPLEESDMEGNSDEDLENNVVPLELSISNYTRMEEEIEEEEEEEDNEERTNDDIEDFVKDLS